MRGVKLYISLVVLLLAVLFGVVLYFYNTISYSGIDLFKAIPRSNAVAILQVKKISSLEDRLKDANSAQREVFNNFLFQGASRLLNQVTDVFPKISDSIVAIDIQSRQFTLSSHLESDSSIALLYLFQVQNRVEKDALLDAFHQKYPGRSVYKHRGINILNFAAKKGELSLYLTDKDGLFLVSNSKKLIEQSYDQVSDSATLDSNLSFTKLLQLSNASKFDNLFLNIPNFKLLGNRELGVEWLDHLSSISLDKTWAEYDIDYKENKLCLNGILIGGSNNGFTQLFESGNGKLTLDKIYPASTLSIFNYSFGGSNFSQSFERFVLTSPYSDSCKIYFSTISSSRRSELLGQLTSLVDSEFGLGYFNHGKESQLSSAFFIKLVASSNALNVLSSFQKSIGLNLVSDEVLKIDSDTKLEIFQGLPSPIMNNIFGSFFPHVPFKFMMVIDGYWVVSDDKELLIRIFREWLINNTLSNNVDFIEYRKNFSKQENVFIYAISSCGSFQIQPIHQDRPLPKVSTIFGSQLVVHDSISFSSVVIDYGIKEQNVINGVWKSHLDSVLAINPQMVFNSLTKENLLLVQDAKNILYLINPIGRILWKRPLESPILGSFIQLREKGALEGNILFNTGDKIFQIDLNGNNIGNFPILLPSKSTCGLAQFDYENNGEFRLFIACADNEIRVYDRKGNLVVGFQAQELEGSIVSPIQHFVSSDKDYILFSDGVSTKILDRKGNRRIAIKLPFQRNEYSRFYLIKDGKLNYFVTSNVEGEVVKIEIPSGEVSFIEGVSGASNHWFFVLENDRNKFQFLFVDKKQLLVLNMDGKVLLNKQLSVESLSDVRVIVNDKGENLVAFLDKANGQLHLYNCNTGESVVGFPKYGEFGYSINFNSNGVPSLFTGGIDNSLISY